MARFQSHRPGTEFSEEEVSSAKRTSGSKHPLLWITLGVVFLIAYFVFSGNRRQPTVTGEAAAPAVQPADSTGKIRPIPKGDKPGDEARAIIASIRKHGGKFNLTWVYNKAGQLLKEKKLADAHLLYFFAAREGHGPSALALGKMADPQHHSPDASLFEQPDPVQALKWYQMANQHGEAAARERLLKLQQWIEEKARAGDEAAQQLILGWR